MSKATLQGNKGVLDLAHVVYDFDVDGGANATPIDLFKLAADTILHDFWFEVEAAVVGSSSTVEVGVTGGDTDGIMAQTAEAVLAINKIGNDQDKGAVLWDDTNDHSIRYKVTAETVLSMLIGTADLTAGKVHFYASYSAGY